MYPISKKRSLSINKMRPVPFVLLRLHKCWKDNKRQKTRHTGRHMAENIILTMTGVYLESPVEKISLAVVLNSHFTIV